MRPTSVAADSGDEHDAAAVDGAPPDADAGVSDAGLRLADISQVTAGARHTCALGRGGDVLCWGDNGDGQLAQPRSVARSARPVQVQLPGSARTLVAGSFHTCALVGYVAYCWGRNACGQVGSGEATVLPKREPTEVRSKSPLEWVAIAPGLDHTCGIETGGAVYCWGCNAKGQSGDVGTGPVTNPANAGPAGDKLGSKSIVAGERHTCITGTNDPGVRCWGTEEWGALGNGPPSSQMSVLAVPALLNAEATAVSVGGEHTCALDATRALYCWGHNDFGQIGLLDAGSSSDSPMARGWGQVSAVACGGSFTCLTGGDNGVRCLGSNQTGELGRGGAVDTARHPDVETVDRPDGLDGVLRARRIAAGQNHACAVLQDTGEVACWGKGSDGQVGDGAVGGGARTSPVFVVAP